VRLLLDTHALLWWLEDYPSLSRDASRAIGETQNDVYVSAVSAMEISTKHRIGKLPHVAPLVNDFSGALSAQGFIALPISVDDGVRAGSLGFAHKDPFDRLLIAQALRDNLTLVSNEQLFDETGVQRLW
jgi:PIN domain nuclease of toxin-antitoxin system